jgi:hypothetical protein
MGDEVLGAPRDELTVLFSTQPDVYRQAVAATLSIKMP